MDALQQAEVLCPACGYDLRGATVDRCSECGITIDRTALSETQIPWAHRRDVGRLRALRRTLAMFILDNRALRLETARPQDARAAIFFTAIIAVAPLLIAWGAWTAVIAIEGRVAFAVQPPEMFAITPTALPGWQQDLAVPWSAGAILWPVLPLCMVPLAWQLASAPARVRAVEGLAEPRRWEGKALMRYASSPLVLLLLGAMLWGLSVMLVEMDAGLPDGVIAILAMAGVTFAVLAVVGTLLRSGQWAARVRRSSLAGWAAAGEVLVRWLLVVVLWLGLVPWCIGFTWIVIDSFL